MPPKLRRILFFVFSTEPWRSIFSYGILLALLISVLILTKVSPIIPGLLIALLFLFTSFKYVFRTFSALEFPKLRTSIRMVRRVRKAYQAGKLARFLYGLLAFSALVCFLTNLIPYANKIATTMALWILILCAAIATLVDSWQRIAYLYKYKWFISLIKWVKWLIGAGAAFFSISIAKQLVHSIVHIDPKFFQEFVYLISAIVYPLALLAVISAILGIFAFMQTISLTIIVCFQLAADMWRSLIPNAENLRVVGVLGRLIRGKKTKTDLVEKLWGSSYIIFRPLATIMLFIVMSQGLIFSPRLYAVGLDKYLNKALIALEFRTGHLCKDISPDTPIAYLDRGNVAVPIIQQERTDYIIKTCVF